MTVSKQQIIQAANAIMAEGGQPTTLTVRARLGNGSCMTINNVLREWRQEKRLIDPVVPNETPPRAREVIDGFSERLWQAIELASSEHTDAVRKLAQTAIAAADHEKDELNIALDKLINEVERLQQQLDELHKQSTNAAKDVQTASQKAELAEAKATTISSERDRLLSQLDELLKRLEVMSREHNKTSDDFAKLGAQFELEKGNHRHVVQQRDEVSGQLQDVIKQREEQIQARQHAESRAARMEKERDEQTLLVKQSVDENKKLKTRIAELETTVTSLSRDYQQSSHGLQMANNKADTIFDERDRLLNESKILSQKTEALGQDNKRLSDELAALRTQFELEKHQHQQIKPHLDELNSHLKEAQHHNQELIQIQRSTENRANRLEEENAALGEKFDNLLHSMEGERRNYQQRLEDERQARQDLDRAASELRIKLAQDNAEAQKALLASQQEIARLQQVIHQLELDLEAERASNKVA